MAESADSRLPARQSVEPATTKMSSALTEPIPMVGHHLKMADPVAVSARNTLATSGAPATDNLTVDSIMSGIFLSKHFMAWNEENLRAHGFTHIIIIDKHIQELYYPAPLFKLSTSTDSDHLYDEYISQSPLRFGKDFEAIDLNFGEKSYLTTVLPNCYRAVKFINKALQNGGTVLVIDCNGGEQKCITIVVAYLMYKHNLNFKYAFARLKEHYKDADLDRFYMSQLYEYEPILQVHRAQSRGHSCSRDLHSSILKRKKSPGCSDGSSNRLFDTINPLNQFKMDVPHHNNNNNTKDSEEPEQASGSSLENNRNLPSAMCCDSDFMD